MGLHRRNWAPTASKQPMTDQEKKIVYISTKAAAGLLSLHPSTLKRWRVEGGGPRFVTLNGRTIRYSTADLDAYIAMSAAHHSNNRRK